MGNKKSKVYITQPEFRNSRFIDYNQWSRAKEMDALVDHLYNEFGFNYTDYKINLKMIVVNLYQSFLVDPTQYVNFFRTTNRYKFIDKYNANKNITSTYVIGSVDKLHTNGYIFHRPGKHFIDEVRGSIGYTSTMRAEPKLIELFNTFDIKPKMIELFDEDAGLIVMKPKKKEDEKRIPIDFKVTRAVADMITVLRNYNRLLKDSYIDLDIECISESDKEALKDKLLYDEDISTGLDLTKKRVKRVFNNNSWHQGGRFYSAWWMGCPSVLRKYIYIYGEPTIELDYSGIHIHLLYAIKGINYASKNEDPYSLIPNDPLRPLNKEILLTAINAKSPHSAAKAVMSDLTRADKDIYNVSGEKFLEDQLELLRLKHQPIADSIASGKGIELQCYDSNIVERIIVFFTKRQIPILTVHDSIVIQARYADLLNEIMWEEYKSILLKKLKYKIRCNRRYPLARYIFQRLPCKYKSELIPTIINKIKIQLSDNTKAIVPAIFKGIDSNDIIGIKETKAKVVCLEGCSYHRRKRVFLKDKITVFYCKMDWRTYLKRG